MSSEEMELTEVTVEALTAIIQHPHTNRYKNHVMKCSADMLYKFEKILENERNSLESNKVSCRVIFLPYLIVRII
jgi:hypothetical protein